MLMYGMCKLSLDIFYRNVQIKFRFIFEDLINALISILSHVAICIQVP